jgi:hypothetical protein
MNILKIKKQKSGGTLALFEKDSYLSVSESVSQSVSDKAKLIRGDPPKIALKRRGSPLKMHNSSQLDKRFRLVYELSYLVEKKFSGPRAISNRSISVLKKYEKIPILNYSAGTQSSNLVILLKFT